MIAIIDNSISHIKFFFINLNFFASFKRCSKYATIVSVGYIVLRHLYTLMYQTENRMSYLQR